jgi:SHS2 domain-containing protein
LHARKSLLETTVGYTFLPHTTDAYVQATGTTIEEAFGYAATALIDTMCNVDTVSASMSEELHVEAADEVILLYNWLELLLLKFELEHRVLSSFEGMKISRQSSKFFLHTKASGEIYDRKKHGAKVEVKAVTLHRMEVLTKDQLTIVRFILDL